MDRPIYVTGHKNPDSDSICSSLAYANLLQLQGYNAISCRLGPLNEESKFVTKYFDIEGPLLIKDARSQIRDIEIDTPVIIHHKQTIKDAWELILKTKNRSLMVVDDVGKLCGILSTSNLATIRIMEDSALADLVKTAIAKDVSKTVNGKLLFEPTEFKTNGKVHILYSMEKEKLERLKDAICIISADETEIIKAIEIGAKCIISANNRDVSANALKKAEEYDCAIIKTKMDTMSIAKVINECYKIDLVMTKDIFLFRDEEYLSDVNKKMRNSRFRSYPVLNEYDEIVGQVSRYHLANYQKKQFVLVDHSERNQTIKNIDEAEILEIIDHHHIGSIQTDYPINFRNVKCGCTASIITQMYKEKGFEPSRTMSGVLLSAIISDTLCFKSLTTTQFDIDQANYLAKRAEVVLEDYALLLLSASVDIKQADLKVILRRDLKVYEIGKYKIAIGQTNYKDIEDIQVISDRFRKLLEQEQEVKQYDLIIMMFTHVTASGTIFEYAGPLSYIMEQVIETVIREGSGFDHEILSRKQQMIPKMSAILKRM